MIGLVKMIVAGCALLMACDGPLQPRGKKLVRPQPDQTADGQAPDRPAPEQVVVKRNAAVTASIVTVASDTTPKVTYLDVEPIFKEHCVNCHKSFPMGGGLNLEKLPFTSYFRGDDQVTLMKVNLLRMRDEDGRGPMPSTGKLPDELIEKVEQWLLDGLLEKPVSETDALPAHVASIEIYWRLKGSSNSDESRLEVAVEDLEQTTYSVTLPALTVGASYVMRALIKDKEGNVITEKPSFTWLFNGQDPLAFAVSLAI